MVWPAGWRNPAALDLLTGSPVNYLVIRGNSNAGAIAETARWRGIESGETAPGGVTIVKGEWPGVRLAEAGRPDASGAGPTGVPWVDSNGWKIRLAAARQPGTEVWIEAVPSTSRPRPEPYQLGVADAAACGGRWMLALEDRLAEGIAAQEPGTLEIWRRLMRAAAFFASRQEWAGHVPEAVIGVVSDFAGDNEFFSQEILNLVARTNQQYRIILKGAAAGASFTGLRAMLYPDNQAPEAALRRRILAFVESGGTLITGPRWGPPEGVPQTAAAHPRYTLRTLGKGKFAVSKAEFDDPFVAANDAVVLMSHRHELLRLWNPGAVAAQLSAAPDRTRALAQLVFFATAREGDPSVRIAGRYRSARLWTLDRLEPLRLEIEAQKGAVEVHLPPVSVYAAVELEA
jgi:hypothetical protein